MKLFKTFVKRNALWIGLIFILVLVQDFYLYLMGVVWYDLAYAILLEGFLVLLVGLIGFVSYLARVRKLQYIAMESESENLDIPEAVDAIDEAYQDIIENVNINRKLVLGECRQKEQEMQEYYSMWVHQVKTPISAMHLLMQLKKEDIENQTNMDLPENVVDILEQKDLKELEIISDLDEELFKIEQYVGSVLKFQQIQSTETKNAIQSQIRLVFFLPIVTASIHVKAAFPMIRRLLAMMHLNNVSLFFTCLVATILVFTVIYYIVFKLTSRVYYKIVGNQVR